MTPESIVHSDTEIQLNLTKLTVSGFADNVPPPGNLFVELEVDGTHRHRCVMECQGVGKLVSESLSDVLFAVTPSSFIDCELWYESEDKVNQSKLCECTVKITEAVCQAANSCEHKSGKHEWIFEFHGPSVSDYALPSSVEDKAEGLVDELRQTFMSLHHVSHQISRLSGDQWLHQEEFEVAWQFFSYAYNNYHETDTVSNRAALDDAMKDTLTQLRLGLDSFEARAKQSIASRRALYWYDGLDLVSQSVIQAAALIHKYTLDLASASSRMRSLFLDRCQQLQDDIIRYRVMFVQNGGSAKPLQRDLKGDTLSVLMKLLVSSVDYDSILLSLRGRQAGRALEILQDLILNLETGSTAPADAAPTLPQNEVRRRLRTLLGQVAQLSDRIPPSLFVDGVKWNNEVISRTKSSDVISGTYKKERVVIKRVKLPIKNVATDSSQKTKKSLLRVLGWKTLKHDFLLPFLGVAVKKPGKDSDGLHLVYPRMEYSNAIAVLGKKLTTDPAIAGLVHRWILEVAEGMSYLHGENIVHGDLRARNILIDRNYCIRIADFDLAALAEEAGVNYMTAHPSLVRWLAPELLSADLSHLPTKQTFASDVYAFACVCLELYTCEVPYARTADKQVAALVLDGTRPERPSTPGNDSEPMDEDLWKIIQQCWDTDAAQRPTAHAVVESITAFINGGNEIILTDSEKAVTITDEPEQMTRSDSPETVTSEFSTQPDTPIDAPTMDVGRGVHSRSVEDYKSADQVVKSKTTKTITLDDVPPPPYARVDPSIRVALAIPPAAPILEKSLVESPTREDSTNSATEATTEAIPNIATTTNDQPNTRTEETAYAESQTIDDPVQVPQDHGTSDGVHEDHTETNVHYEARIDDLKEQSTFVTSPETQRETPAEEKPEPSEPSVASDASPAAPTPAILATSAPAIEISDSTDILHEQTPASYASVPNAVQALTSDAGGARPDSGASNGPQTEEKADAEPSHDVNETVDVAGADNANQSEEQDKEISSPTVNQVEYSAVPAPAPTQQDAPEPPAPVLSEGTTAQLNASIPANSNTPSENAAGIVKESVQPSGAQEGNAMATLEQQLQSATEQTAVSPIMNTDTVVALSDVTQAHVSTHQPHGVPVTSEAPPTAKHEEGVTASATETREDHAPTATVETEAQPGSANGDSELIASAQEQNLSALPLNIISSATTQSPIPFTASEVAAGAAQVVNDGATADNTGGQSDSRDSNGPSDEFMTLDADLAPLPDPATWDTSVAKRASIRLVNRPAPDSLTDELPIVEDVKEEEHEGSQAAPEQPANGAETSTIGIQQEAREQQPVVQPQSPAANGAAKPTQNTRQNLSSKTTPTKAGGQKKGSKKGSKDADEMHGGCCAKCIIM